MTLEIPDLNQDDFYGLTLTRQVQQIKAMLDRSSSDVVLIGSSLGGLTAALLIDHCPQIQRLILLAPALDFLSHWISSLPKEVLFQWHSKNHYEMFHFDFRRPAALSFDFIQDLQSYKTLKISRQVPLMIFHGKHDETIPHHSIQDFVLKHPWVDLFLLEGDHSLIEHLPFIWCQMKDSQFD